MKNQPNYYRIKGEVSDLALMIWPMDEIFVVQIGAEMPYRNTDKPERFATLVTDLMWLTDPITAKEWHIALAEGVWPDGKEST